MMAMKMINEALKRNGKIRSFTSYCGGLPSPAAANNPLAYKFRYYSLKFAALEVHSSINNVLASLGLLLLVQKYIVLLPIQQNVSIVLLVTA